MTGDHDADGDGYEAEASGGDDCDDADAAVSPAATELVADGIDQDCDGVDACYADDDGDGYGTTVVVDGSTLDCSTGDGAAVSTDCDDGDGRVNPGQPEMSCDGIDQDCDGADRVECSLSDADAKYTGEASGDHAGWSVSAAGDVDADGYDDLLIGANNNDDGGSDAGAAYLVLGSASPTSLGLASANAQYTGPAASANERVSVSAAGDVNADGYGDLLIGAYAYENDRYENEAGAAYLVLGSASPTSLGLAWANAQYTGEAEGDQAGGSVSAAGDIDADGYDDLLIGAEKNNDGGDYAGAAYLVLGSASPASLGLGSADAQYTGEARWSVYAGGAVSDAGDVNADGYDDLLIGAHQNDDGGEDAGAAYLVLGSAQPGSLSLGSADAQYTGDGSGDSAGNSVSGAGDINADGYDDLLIGATRTRGYGPGTAYLVLGSASPTSSGLASATAQYGGEANVDNAGASVSTAGDINADGYDDLLIGADRNDGDGGSDAGAAYLVLGSASPVSLGLGSADARYAGESFEDYAGKSVSGAGDINADGYDDVFLGAWGNDDGPGNTAGSAYLILSR